MKKRRRKNLFQIKREDGKEVQEDVIRVSSFVLRFIANLAMRRTGEEGEREEDEREKGKWAGRIGKRMSSGREMVGEKRIGKKGRKGEI